MPNPKPFFWKHLLFSEARPLVDVGRRSLLSEVDIMELPESQVPRDLEFHARRLNFSSGKKLVWSNLAGLGAKFRWAIALFFVSMVASLVTPVFVNHFIRALTEVGELGVITPICWGLGLSLMSLINGTFTQHYFYFVLGCEQISTRVLNRKIFLHSLRLSVNARSRTPVGDIVNHMSTDSDGVSEFVFVFCELLELIVTTIGVSGLLFYYLGTTALAPLTLFFILTPLTKKLAGRFSHLDHEMMKARDHRVTLITQILSAIRLVKYFVWEKSVFDEVDAIRETELGARRKMAQTEVMANAAYTSVSSIVLFVALFVHVWRGQMLDAPLIFTCISLFGILQAPLGRISNLLSRATNSFVGARRLVGYLKKETNEEHGNKNLSSSPNGFKIKGVSVAYKESAPILKNISFEIAAGESVAIVGPVGCGKSTLLLALLDELQPVSGTILITDTAIDSRRAYCPQEAYIINSTLRENLTFGEDVTELEIGKALKSTALDQDLRLFPAGLNTEIGERGVNLSGGQKQRVALARAQLSRPGVVFLDDPLSAVDVHTEKHLVDHLLFGDWKNVTRILTTHRMESLEKFDKIIFLRDGNLIADGSFAEIITNADFAGFYSSHQDIAKAENQISTSALNVLEKETHSRITEDEERERGAVKSSVYLDYVLSLGGIGRGRNYNIFLLFFGSACVTLMPLLQKAWLARMNDGVNPMGAVEIYGVLGVIAMVIGMGNGLFWLKRGVAAGRNIHRAMLNSILSAPIRFFDSTPVGRIIQRFSRDIESVDVYLQWTFDSAVHCFLEIIVTLLLIALVLPVTLLAMLPLLIFYYFLQGDYRRPAREIKRLDSLARSPRYAHFKETLMGLTVIRGFRKEKWFIENFQQRLFYSQKVFYNAYILNRWFSARIPILGGLIAAATAICLSLAVQRSYISAGTGGLLIVYSLSFWDYLNWGIRVFSDIESRMTSMERLKFYSSIPPEASSQVRAPTEPGWPQEGRVSFREVTVRYAPHLPQVLKKVSFEVNPGERIGLIGRTGSGKSTLLQALFRFVDIESGSIILDGRDIANVSLDELRRNLAIIPQDPILFIGTVRSNLDRYGQYGDHQIENALRSASMWEFIQSLPLGLRAPVTENGSNFSQGQRQLLCLARALLVKAKVVVLDEATASVDVHTDAIIQKVIRESLKGTTLLIVAHRLGTVADSDRIIELSQGQVMN